MKDQRNPDWWTEIDPQFEFEKTPAMQEVQMLLKVGGEIELPEDELFFDQMHDRIMKGIEGKTIHADRGSIWQRKRHLAKRTVAAFLAMLVVMMGRQTTKSSLHDPSTVVLKDALNRTEIENSILVSEHKNEFFVDLMSENLDHLSVSQLKRLISAEAQN